MNIPIHIEIPIGISYPSIAVIPFAEGLVTKEQLNTDWQLCEVQVPENSFREIYTPVNSFKEIVGLWPGSLSIKWIHVHGIFLGGKKYSLSQLSGARVGRIPIIPPDNIGMLPKIALDNELDWEVQVEDKNNVFKNTAEHRSTLQIIRAQEYSLNLINVHGGWSKHRDIFDERNSHYSIERDETKFEEVNDRFLRITRYEGWLKDKNGRNSIFRYCTRITRYASHPLIKISNRVTFAGSMHGKRLRHISFVVTDTKPFPIETKFGVENVDYNFTLHNTSDRVAVHQRRIDRCDVTTDVSSPVLVHLPKKSDGYVTKGITTLMVRDFWQKFPQALECDQDTITYRQWYGGDGLPVFDELKPPDPSQPLILVKERLHEKNLHKLMHWHQGRYLENDIPISNAQQNQMEWADLFYARIDNEEHMDTEEGNSSEDHIAFTKNADMQGISIHDDIAFNPQTKVPNILGTNSIETTWNKNPVGHCAPSYIESTNVSDFGAKATDYNIVEEFLEDSILSYTCPDRFEDYGRFLYGESHRNIFVSLDRPSRHRIGLSSYYCAGETYWRMWLRGASEEILMLARRNTERYRSILQVSYDVWTYWDPLPPHSTGPEIFWHNPGGFWYRGLWWGSSDADRYKHEHNVTEIPQELQQEYSGGVDHGGWCTLDNRIPDPDSLLWSWILDGNRHHKDGYELWYKNAKKDRIRGMKINPSAPLENYAKTVRNLNKMLVYAITAYEYFSCHPNSNFRDTEGHNGIDLSQHIRDIGNNLLRIPFDTPLIDGPLWQPEWIRKYVEFLVRNGDPQVNIDKVLDFACNKNNYNGFFQDGQKTLDMTTLLLDIASGKYPDYHPQNPPQDFPSTIIDPEFIAINDQLDWISRICEKIYKGEEDNRRWLNFGIGDGELGDAWFKLQWGAFLKRLRVKYPNVNQLSEYDYHGHYPCSVQGGGASILKPNAPAIGNQFWIYKDDADSLKLQFKFSPTPMNTTGTFTFREIWIFLPLIVPVPPMISEMFISVYLEHLNASRTDYEELTPLNYPSPTNTPLSSLFNSMSIHNLRNSEIKNNWVRSDVFITPGGTENYTIQDTLPTSATGIFKMYMSGKSVYPGLTKNNLHEVMVLTPIDNTNRDAAGDYVFTDSIFYLKNPGSSKIKLTIWASVLVSPPPDLPPNSFGSFVRVKIKDTTPSPQTKTFEMKYSGGGYGDPLSGKTICIDPYATIHFKTVLIYNNSMLRMKIEDEDGQINNVQLLCGRTLDDIEVLESAHPGQ